MYMCTDNQHAYTPKRHGTLEAFGFLASLVVLFSDFFHLSTFLKAKQSLATLTKDVPKRHSLAMPTETVVNGNNQEWVMQADLPLTAAIRQSQQTLYVHTGHPTDRQGRTTCGTHEVLSCRH